MKTLHLLLLFACACIGNNIVFSQETFPRNDVLDNRTESYAFINATIVVDSKTTLKNATLLIKKGVIENVGTGIAVPKGFTSIDLQGKYIYPSFIDLHTNYGIPEMKRQRGGGFGGAEQIQSKTKGAYNANEAIKAHYNASQEFTIDAKAASTMRSHGFGAVLSFKGDGISRGTSAFVSLGEGLENEVMLNETAAAHYSLNKGSSRQNYPSSMMGYISLLRQTYLDAEWYGAQSPRPYTDKTLEAWISQQRLPQLFDAGNWLNVLRADKVADEFSVNYIIKSGGDSYKRINEIKAANASLIVPVRFPDAYDVQDPIDAERVSLADMKHWELAPTNPGVLEKNGINFALTSSGSGGDFLSNVKKAIKHGLSESVALASLTSVPAALLDMQDRIGTIKKGLVANFLITSGEIFKDKTKIHENWIQGKPYRMKPLNTSEHSGTYVLNIGGKTYQMEISGDPGSQKSVIVIDDSTSVDIQSKFDNDLITLGIKENKKDKDIIRLSGWTTANGWKGTGQLVDGSWVSWDAVRSGDIESKEGAKKGRLNPDRLKVSEGENMGSVIYPFVAFGKETLPTTQTLLIKNATVWTNEEEGILSSADVLLSEGKIARIGNNLSVSGAKIIDGTGKHLTSGIIDEHTHIGGGGNDRATNSSMVRIGDQINPDQVSIYRTLAGGVTAAQVLHGSANPVGGQSALIKLRWGESPENMKIKGADEFIKFALGENVKRSSNSQSIRYPQSRMGVEQVYVDGFNNALEYEKEWKAYEMLSPAMKEKAVKPRRDLVDEAMLEIINGERFITCHSYVQSEINMLMKVADDFNFTVNTFTHILEGYKVADKMKEHGVAASTFSDWWNYKWEVRYAIPYNAAIMHREGVLTAINSDDANMGRRLNQEAAKTIKYGGLSEEDAWKMVTLNPAKMLHLDDQMGSIKVGKDADVVLWTEHPLSVYARAEKTIIDGKIYFDIEEDKTVRENMRKERARLIQKMKDAKKKGSRMQKPNSTMQMHFHCDDDYDLGIHNHVKN
ncbi:MAG: amidohydrolase family protein [Saprospiraceae bacterium]|nr:amidohydrolase family protein [Saprospiraceae bacterium]